MWPSMRGWFICKYKEKVCEEVALKDRSPIKVALDEGMVYMELWREGMWRSGIKGWEVFYQSGPWWVVGLYRKIEELREGMWRSGLKRRGVSFEGGPSLGVSLYKQWPIQLADIYIHICHLPQKGRNTANTGVRARCNSKLLPNPSSGLHSYWFGMGVVEGGGLTDKQIDCPPQIKPSIPSFTISTFNTWTTGCQIFKSCICTACKLHKRKKRKTINV